MEELCAWLVVLLLLSSFLHSLFSFLQNKGDDLEEGVRKTERVLHLLWKEPGLLELPENLEGIEIWGNEGRVGGKEKPPRFKTVMLPTALKRGFSSFLVEVGAW